MVIVTSRKLHCDVTKTHSVFLDVIAGISCKKFKCQDFFCRFRDFSFTSLSNWILYSVYSIWISHNTRYALFDGEIFFIVTLEGSSTEFLVAVTFRIGTQIESFFFLFFFFKWLFWVVLNILSTNELKKKKKKVGYFWDLIQGPLNLASDALPTELRGLSLQGNS